ncbi:hypothetical protein [Roseivivax marinus]|uniref:hypothetical protein n=2 Tax=Roseivivax marinus TaxID=1379903 RepID=UPI00273E610C|nr:hypothetical protein [Roseivivax marinus]
MMRFVHFGAGAALLALLPVAASAQEDEITEALDAARSAYEDGDIQFAIDELDFARQRLLELKTDALERFLPEAPEGWSREIDTDMAQGLAFMGGGVGAGADYEGPDGETVSMSLMADNPMVASMAGMIANAAMMGMTVERVGRQRIALQDDQAMALIGNRVLLQAEGAAPEVLMSLIEQVDFDALTGFGQ